MTTQVRPAVAADIPAVARIYAAAFADDPVMSWAYPRGERRGRKLGELYSAILRWEGMPFGATSVAVRDGGVVGAAVWRRRGRHGRPSWREAPFALASARALDGNTGRMIALGRAVGRLRPPHPHWYLQILGVDPDAQRSGAGSALVEHRLRIADADRTPSYLETTAENLPFYARFGFVPTSSTQVGDGPREYALWREPV